MAGKVGLIGDRDGCADEAIGVAHEHVSGEEDDERTGLLGNER